ncbi:MAG TPA: glutathione transferase GstA [Stellaceae bacterium]|nr:glutathione transferase GstA [Stellaceae bacterium]
MVKFYFSPGACSLSPHIVLRESGLPFELEQVNLQTKKLKSGGDFLEINPKGQVPVLKLDSGDILTEGPAIVQYIADQKPESGLAPKAGTIQRYHVQEWLNFITSELHKSFTPLFRQNTPEEYAKISKENLANRFSFLDKELGKRQYLMGDKFTVPDAYAFTVVGWSKYKDIDLSRWPNLKGYMDRVGARPKVQEAIKAEGLLK